MLATSPEFMQEMMPWWFIHMDLDGRVAVASNMIAGVDPGFVPVLRAGSPRASPRMPGIR